MVVLAEDAALATVLVEDAGDDGDEGGFAAAGGADEHHEFAGLDVEVDAAERVDDGVAGAVGLDDVVDVDGEAVVVRAGLGVGFVG